MFLQDCCWCNCITSSICKSWTSTKNAVFYFWKLLKYWMKRFCLNDKNAAKQIDSLWYLWWYVMYCHTSYRFCNYTLDTFDIWCLQYYFKRRAFHFRARFSSFEKTCTNIIFICIVKRGSYCKWHISDSFMIPVPCITNITFMFTKEFKILYISD